MSIPRIVITSGEPAGIGPDLCIALAQQDWPCELIFAIDPQLLEQRCDELGVVLKQVPYRRDAAPQAQQNGQIVVWPFTAATKVVSGELNPANAGYVLQLLDAACDGCLRHEFAAMVTAPVQKSVINAAGIAFTGHTEYLAARSGGHHPVMLLTSGTLRVALVTTHLPLNAVSKAITRTMLTQTIEILHRDLRDKFGIERPCILVLGLNPHAGEAGYLGHEEIDVIAPVLETLRAQGLALLGPAPADTAFTPRSLQHADAVLAMYHDQGLPVLKYAGFGNAVNVTLGLPIVRTSVDHGTALELAGTGKAEVGSMLAALELAVQLAGRR